MRGGLDPRERDACSCEQFDVFPKRGLLARSSGDNGNGRGGRGTREAVRREGGRPRGEGEDCPVSGWTDAEGRTDGQWRERSTKQYDGGPENIWPVSAAH